MQKNKVLKIMYKYLQLLKIKQIVKSLRLLIVRWMVKSLLALKSLRLVKYPRPCKNWKSKRPLTV